MKKQNFWKYVKEKNKVLNTLTQLQIENVKRTVENTTLQGEGIISELQEFKHYSGGVNERSEFDFYLIKPGWLYALLGISFRETVHIMHEGKELETARGVYCKMGVGQKVAFTCVPTLNADRNRIKFRAHGIYRKLS